MVWVNFCLLAVGLLLVIKGSDYFVRSAASIAKKFGVSEFIIGLTLIAIGTSLPELVSAIIASLEHESGFIIGNIVGANIANIGLIIGISSIIAVIKTKKEMVSRDGIILLFISLLLFVIVSNGVISRIEGITLLLFYLAYTIFLFEAKPEFKGNYGFHEFIKYFFKFQYIITIKSKLLAKGKGKRKRVHIFEVDLIKDFVLLISTGFLVIFGAKYLVDNAIFFAEFFNMPKMVIGALVAIGTTMPELSVALSAIKKGLGNIIIGTAIGSCITNTLLILGIASIIHPISILRITIDFAVPYFFFMVVLLIIFIKSDWKIKRYEGIVFLIFYLVFLFSLLKYF